MITREEQTWNVFAPPSEAHPTDDSARRDPSWSDPGGRVYRCEIRLCPESEGGYSVYSPELPGVVSEGENAEEAVRNMAEALQAALQTYLADNGRIPWKKDIESPGEGETRLGIVVNV